MFCPAGGFYIDPWRTEPGMQAIITHAHSDHLRSGCGSYLCSPSCAPLVRARLGASTPLCTQGFGAARAQRVGDVRVTLYPAGHVLGSAMIRVERAGGGTGGHEGGVWLVTGDYKLTPDGVSETAEITRCDTLVTESTFGLPIYRWPAQDVLMDEINAWWRGCQGEGRTAVLFAYPLGKSQRVLANVDASIGPLLAHGAVRRINEAYGEAGARLPEVGHATREAVKRAVQSGRAPLVVAPPSADGSAWLRGFGDVSRAFASGWMAIRGTRRRRSMDRGFALSDHVDWAQLMTMVRETGCTRVGVTHGYVHPVARWLRERGLESWVIRTHFEGEEEGTSEVGGPAVPDGEDAPAAPRPTDLGADAPEGGPAGEAS